MNTGSKTSSTYNINSRHYSDKIDSDIILLTKTLSVEYEISIDDAKAMARKMIQRKLNSILSKEEHKGISLLCDFTKKAIKKEYKIDDNYTRLVYETLKTMELE